MSEICFALWFYNLEGGPGSLTPLTWSLPMFPRLCIPLGAGRVNPRSLAGTREVIAVGSGHTEFSLLAQGTAVTQ